MDIGIDIESKVRRFLETGLILHARDEAIAKIEKISEKTKHDIVKACVNNNGFEEAEKASRELFKKPLSKKQLRKIKRILICRPLSLSTVPGREEIQRFIETCKKRGLFLTPRDLRKLRNLANAQPVGY